MFLPYCLQRLASGRWLVLNRGYKPLGAPIDQRVDYETVPGARVKLTAAAKRKLDYKGNGDPTADRIWLYNDGCLPTASPAHWRAYQARLEVLAKLRTE